VDNSKKIVEFGAAKAKKNGVKNLEFRQGDLQHRQSIREAWICHFEPGASSRR